MRTTIRRSPILLAGILLFGCASKPVVVDNSPILRTAQMTSTVTSTGVKGFFGYNGSNTSITYENMRRVDQSFKFSGSIMSRVGGKQDTSDIIRVDQGVEWQVDNRKKSYQECPLGGCEGTGSFTGAVMDSETEDDFEEETTCKMITAEQTFNVNKTGQTRTLNGFQAEEYLIDWRVLAQDDQGGKAENLIEITVWTTPVTPVIAEALAMKTKFDKNYAAALSNKYPESVQKAIPREAMALLERFFIESMSDADAASLLKLMDNTASIEGFPISRKVKWDARNDTCSAPPEPKEEEKGRLNTSSFKGLIASVGKEIINQEVEKKRAEKAREIELAPILLFIDDVTSIEMVDARESRLTVPANYKLITRR